MLVVRRPHARLADAVAARLRRGRDGRPGPLRAAARPGARAGARAARRRAGRGARRRHGPGRPRAGRHLGADAGPRPRGPGGGRARHPHLRAAVPDRDVGLRRLPVVAPLPRRRRGPARAGRGRSSGSAANLLGRAAEGAAADALPALLARVGVRWRRGRPFGWAWAAAGRRRAGRLGRRPPRTSCWRWPSSSACGRPGRTSSASAWSSPPSAAPGAAGSWPAAGSSGSSPRTRPAPSPSGRCATGAATRATSPCWPATSSPRSCSS